MNRTFTLIALQSAVAAAIISIAPLASAGQMAASVHTSTDHAQDPTRAAFVSTASREQVRAEAIAAARQPTTSTDNAQDPTRAPFTSTVSRAQVHAEAVEATRLRVTTGTESQRELTAMQLAQIRNAGLRAVQGQDLVAVKQ